MSRRRELSASFPDEPRAQARKRICAPYSPRTRKPTDESSPHLHSRRARWPTKVSSLLLNRRLLSVAARRRVFIIFLRRVRPGGRLFQRRRGGWFQRLLLRVVLFFQLIQLLRHGADEFAHA